MHRAAVGSGLPALGGALRQVLRDGALGVALDDAGAIGVAAVDEHLDFAVAHAQSPGKIRADADDAVDLWSSRSRCARGIDVISRASK